QKAFTVGTHAASVIAGLGGAEIRAEGFHLRDALGSHLVELDRGAGNGQVTALDVARTFVEGLHDVSGLLIPDPRPRPIIVGEVSTVSVTPSGEPDWITFVTPLDVAHEAGEAFFEASTPIFFQHATNLG